MSKTILVTGAAGFIGSHAVETFLKRGDRVVGLDNLNDYYDPRRKLANWAEAAQNASHPSQVEFIKGDIRDPGTLAEIFEEHSIDAIVHLAAMAGVGVSINDPHLYYGVNLIGTLNLLDAARRAGVPKFVFASTSSVYGNTEKMPFSEEDHCDRPLAPYPASKRAAEMLGYTYHHLYGIDFTVLRFFTVYGPRGRTDMMAYKVAENICFGREVPLYNKGNMHRDWTYVGDIVNGIAKATDAVLGYEIINLGRGEPVLLANFVRILEEITGRQANLVDAQMPDTDIRYTFADISKARKLLGYAPSVGVGEGIERFWKWYQKAVLREGVASAVA